MKDEDPKCPDCGGRLADHSAVNRIPGGLIAHSAKGGACWKSLNTPFTKELSEHLLKEFYHERTHYTITPARYAKDMFALTTPRSTDGFKTPMHWLAEACGGRWTHRDCGYQLTANQARTFETLQRNGWEGKIRLGRGQPALVEKDGRVMSPREAAKL